MGRRSRKRVADVPAATRAERDAARRARRAVTAADSPARAARSGRPRRTRPGRPTIDERPPAPWGNFPLSELLVLGGIVLMAWGLATWSGNGNTRFAAGLVLASLAGLEISLREHLAGYRSHTTLLAGAAAFLAVTALALGPGPNRIWVLLVAAAVVFAGAFAGLRQLFRRRSGGLSFR
jgi:hypothetical protein